MGRSSWALIALLGAAFASFARPTNSTASAGPDSPFTDELGRAEFKYFDPALRKSQPAAAPTPNLPRAYKTRADFPSDQAYGAYVKETLSIGMRVRARVDYQSVKKGMHGIYFGTNGGTPPCLVMWDDDLKSGSVLIDPFPKERASHAYWVDWHQVELGLEK